MKAMISLKAFLEDVMPFIGAFLGTIICSFIFTALLHSSIGILTVLFAIAALAGVVSACTSRIIKKLNEVEDALSEIKEK